MHSLTLSTLWPSLTNETKEYSFHFSDWSPSLHLQVLGLFLDDKCIKGRVTRYIYKCARPEFPLK